MYRYPRPRRADTLGVYALVALLLALILLPAGIRPPVAVNINERALVHAIGIDRTEQGYDLTLQIFQPSGPGADTSVDAGKPNVAVIECSGETVSKALSDGRGKAGQELFLGHLQLICLGWATDLSDPRETLSFALTNNDIPLNTRLCMSTGPAEELMKAKLSRSETSSQALFNILKNGEDQTAAPRCELLWALSPEVSAGCYHLPLLRTEKSRDGGDDTVEIAGSAVCQRGRTYALSPEETSGAILLSGKARHLTVTVTHRGRPANLSLRADGYKMRAARSAGAITLSPELTLIAAPDESALTPELSEEYAAEAEAEVRRLMSLAERSTLRRNGSDVFGLLRQLRMKLPSAYYSASPEELLGSLALEPVLKIPVE